MLMENNRISLRPWAESDAPECYRYAQNPNVSLPGGWQPHTSIEDSRSIIRDRLMKPEVYAIILKDTGLPIGAVGLLQGKDRSLTDKPVNVKSVIGLENLTGGKALCRKLRTSYCFMLL